jgi:hypothetical protein
LLPALEYMRYLWPYLLTVHIFLTLLHLLDVPVLYVQQFASVSV